MCFGLKIKAIWSKNKRIWSKIGLKIKGIRTKNKCAFRLKIQGGGYRGEGEAQFSLKIMSLYKHF
jgi:hypothetical protein